MGARRPARFGSATIDDFEWWTGWNKTTLSVPSAAVQKRAADVAAKRAKIKELVAQGKSLDEIKAAVGDPPAQAKGGGRGGPAFASFTDVVYQELTKKTP